MDGKHIVKYYNNVFYDLDRPWIVEVL